MKWFCFIADDEESCLDRLEGHCWPEDDDPPATLYTTDEPFNEDCDDCDEDCAKGPPLAM